MSLVFFFLVFILSILFTIEPTNLKNLSKKHDQNSINLTNVFDHGLTTSLSIFLFLIYLLIRPNVCLHTNDLQIIYVAWFTFWLNINEIQSSKRIVKNRNPIFLDSALFSKFPLSRSVWNNIYKSCCLYIIYFIFHSSWRQPSELAKNIDGKKLPSLIFFTTTK